MLRCVQGCEAIYQITYPPNLIEIANAILESFRAYVLEHIGICVDP